MYFGYMRGNIDNQNFYLKKLITHLRNLESVELLGSKKITEIPYYNATEKRDQQISFKIIPGADMSLKESAFQIALAIQDEVQDLETVCLKKYEENK